MLTKYKEWVHRRREKKRQKRGQVTLAHDQRILLTFVIILLFSVIYFRIGISVAIALAIFVKLESVWCIYADKKLEVTYEKITDYAEKKAPYTFRVTLKNKGILPTPFIKLTLKKASFIDYPEREIDVYLKPRGTKVIDVVCSATLSGQLPIDWSGSYLYPLLTPIKKEIKKSKEVLGTAAILPEIKNEQITDNEMTIEEHFKMRQYRQGDSVRDVNWKVYAKTEELLVRERESYEAPEKEMLLEEEKSNMSEKRIILDCYMPNDYYYERVDKVLEKLLSKVYSYVNQEIYVEVFFRGKDTWQKTEVSKQEEMERLRQTIIFAIFETDKERAKQLLGEMSEEDEVISIEDQYFEGQSND